MCLIGQGELPTAGFEARETPRCAPAHRQCRISSCEFSLTIPMSSAVSLNIRLPSWTVCGEEGGWMVGVKQFHELKPDWFYWIWRWPDMDASKPHDLCPARTQPCQ